MFDFIIKMAIVIFGCGFLMFLGAFIYDNYWFKYIIKKEKKELTDKELKRRKIIREFYDNNPDQDPRNYNR